MTLQASEAAVIKGMLAKGTKQHDIAAALGVNSGRIAEIATGKTHAEIRPAEVPGRFLPLTLSMVETLTRRASAAGHPIAEPMTVTHEHARGILEAGLNQGNRPKKPVRIREYHDDMVAGRWQLSGASIKFDDDGYLIDGQNRLMALASSDCSIETMVVFGVPAEMFTTIDVGKPRTAADFLHIEGCPNANKVASTMRWILILQGPRPTDRGQTFNAAEILEAWRALDDAHKALVHKAVSEATKVYNSFGHSVAQLGGAFYTLALVDYDKTVALYELWKQGHARVVQLQKFLADYENKATLKRIPEQVLIGAVIKTWNRFDPKGKRKITISDVATTHDAEFEPWK